MKTIQISDELFDKLINIAQEVDQQDNRATAKPYFFQVQTKKKVYSRDEDQYEHQVYIDPRCDYQEIDATTEGVKELCDAYGMDSPDGVDNWTIDQICDFLESDKFKLEKASYTWQDEYTNAFLTEKACQQHIKQNGYHYSQPVDFLSHAFRNPDLETIFQFLDELVTHQSPTPKP